METSYGIAVTNKFVLNFDDDDIDPYEILKQEQESAQKKKEAAKKEDKTKTSSKNKGKKAPQSENKAKNDEAPLAKKDDRPPRRPKNDGDRQQPLREGNPPRDRRERSDRPFSGAPERSEFRNEHSDRGGFEGRGRGRGFRGGRGRGGSRGGFGGESGGGYRGKRDFDRHSGTDRTGIKPTEKREGGGAHNWGNPKDDIEESLNTTTGSEDNQFTAPSEEVENQDPNESTESAEKEPAEPKEMTLDEYKAQEAAKRAAVSNDMKLNLRNPGEGVDEKQWKKTYVLQKKVTDQEEESEEEEDDEEIERQPKNTVPIEITFYNNPRRGRGGRRGGGRDRPDSGFDDSANDRGPRRGRGAFGGRRGGRGERPGGRGGGGFGARGPRSDVVPDTMNEQDFPTLGK